MMLQPLEGNDTLLPQTAVVFGEHEHLVGVMTAPNHDCLESTADFSDCAALIVTAGMLPSAGPFRLHVELSHALAESGMRSLRFDLSGIGESLAVGGSGSSLERAASEIASAIDWLQQAFGVERVILFGLCSGADDALYAATRDDRIVGLFSMDGCGYRTRKFVWYRLIRKYLPKLFCMRAWKSRLGASQGSDAPTHESLKLGGDVREFPDRETAAMQIAMLVEREVDLHFHYTGGVGEYYNYARQFYDMFASAPDSMRKRIEKVTTSFAPESDHVAFLLEHRDAMISLAKKRMLEMGKRLSVRSRRITRC